LRAIHPEPPEEEGISMSESQLRDQAAQIFIEAFGEPERLNTVDGIVYRWRLDAADGDTIRITLDSPEFPNSAHFLVSDPKALIRLAAQACSTKAEVLSVRDQITRRLKGGGEGKLGG
jgi:hypothetical protein